MLGLMIRISSAGCMGLLITQAGNSRSPMYVGNVLAFLLFFRVHFRGFSHLTDAIQRDKSSL